MDSSPPSAVELELKFRPLAANEWDYSASRATVIAILRRSCAAPPIAVPNFPALRGFDLYFQAAVFRSPGGAFSDTLDLSAGLRLQVGS